MKKYSCVLIGLALSLTLGCLCMMPMGTMHRGHEPEPQKQEISQAPGHDPHAQEASIVCQCDCVEKEGECHCKHSSRPL